ncbi:hypothetical protein [Enterobacter kobei]|uniref:hypothetical protein n=1 Tax=Enterobacter kobei TaxID=208224 RepID=UPI0018E921AC|nr:hypothetical protein [Enterobacter kobei]
MTANKPMTGEQLDELMTVAVNMQRDAETDCNRPSAMFAYAVQVAVLELRKVRNDASALASLEAEPVAFRSKLKHPGAIGSERWDYADHRQPDAFELENCIIERLYTAPPAQVSAEPVAWLWSNRKHPSEVTLVRPEDDEKAQGAHWSGWSCQALYTAPTAPVSVPDEDLLHMSASAIDDLLSNKDRSGAGVWADVPAKLRRAAMLQGAEPVTTAYKLPMQPLVIDAHGTLRFKENPIVRKLLDYATEHGYGLNEIALDEFEAEDQMQLAQLIGYSLSGYGTLSYVTDESYDRAAAAVPQQKVK